MSRYENFWIVTILRGALAILLGSAVLVVPLAEKVSADLIVLGARNASFWLTHIDHGLTTDLLAEASCPVMTACQNGKA